MPCSAVSWRALACPGVRCNTVRCCVVLCRAAALVYTSSFVHASVVRIIIPRIPVLLQQHHQVCTYYVLSVNHNECTSSSAQPTAIYSSAQRRAVPCLALWCGAVSCWAVLSFEHTAVLRIRYQVPAYTCCVLYSSFCFLQLIVFFPSPCFFPPPASYTCTADQNITSSTVTHHSAQHRATTNSSAQAALGIINSLVVPNRGPLLSAPFTCYSCIFLMRAFSYASIFSREQPSERSPCT